MAYSSFDGVFYRMSLDESGVSVLDSTNFQAGAGPEMKLDSGRMYTTSGLVFDPMMRRVLGQFPMTGTLTSYSENTMAVDPAAGRAFILTDLIGGPRSLMAFDERAFALVGRLDIPDIIPSFDGGSTVSSLLRWGDDGLAFRTGGDQVFLFRAPSLMASFVPLTISAEGAVNAASFAAPNPLVPGSLVSLFGSGLALSTAVADLRP